MSKSKIVPATATATDATPAMPTASELLASVLVRPASKPGRQPSPVPDQVREAVRLLAQRVHAGEAVASALTIKKLARATSCRPGRLMAIFRESLDILANTEDEVVDDEDVEALVDVDDEALDGAQS